MNRKLALAIMQSLAVTGTTVDRLDRLRSFSARDWRQTFAWLDDSGLALEFLDALDRAGAAGLVPGSVLESLRSRLANNQQRLARMQQEFASLNRAFVESGIDYAVLKGFSLVPDYTPNPALRTQYDYDYLVHPAWLANARRVVEAAGFHAKSQRPGLDTDGVALFVDEPLDCSAFGEEWYSSRIARRVELHLNLWEHRRDVAVEVPGEVLERKCTVCWAGLRFPVLAGDDALIFQCLHAFHHILDFWCRPSCFLEIARFTASHVSNHGFWEEFRYRIGNRRYLADVAGLVFALSSKLFGAPIPVGFRLDSKNRRSRALDLWVCRYGTDWCLALFPGSKLSLFLHREFVEDPVAWRKIWRSRLLPFHRPARVAEPRESNLKSNWKARWQQGRFVLGRLRYHGAGLASYTWRVRGWRRFVRSQGSRREVGSGQSATVRSELPGQVPISDGLRNPSATSSPPLPDWVALPTADRRRPIGKGPAQ